MIEGKSTSVFEPELSSAIWRGEIPSHWQVKRLKWSISGIYTGIWGGEPDGAEDIICVRVADFDRNRHVVVDNPPTVRSIDMRSRQNRVLEAGDLLIEKSGGGDNQLVGAVVQFDHPFDAVCSNFVARMSPSKGMNSRYLTYLHSSLYSVRLNFPAIKQTTGIQNLHSDTYLNIKVPFPPEHEQDLISWHLDKETAQIDSLVGEKENMLRLLDEKRTALISRAVTRGLEPKASTKHSGLDWLGEIPKDWQIERGKNLFSIRDERSKDGEEELLTVSHITGVTSRAEKEVYMFKADDMTGYKRCMKGDFVTNTLWAWMGAMGVSPLDGIVSPDYHVYTTKGQILPEFMELLCRSKPFVSEVIRWSKGVWSSRLRLYPENFFEIRFPVPPKSGQEEIVSTIAAYKEKTDKLAGALVESIKLLKERRSALITAAVTGQIPTEGMTA